MIHLVNGKLPVNAGLTAFRMCVPALSPSATKS